MLGSKRLCSAVSPMSAAPTSDTEKKKQKRANLKLRLALRAGGVIIVFELTFEDYALKTRTSPRFTAPRESFAVKFVVMKHFGCESSNVQPSCCLDVVVYMLNCVFW